MWKAMVTWKLRVKGMDSCNMLKNGRFDAGSARKKKNKSKDKNTDKRKSKNENKNKNKNENKKKKKCGR